MIKCWFCKYKSVCRPELEYKLVLKKEGELFRKWWNVDYKKGKDKDNKKNDDKCIRLIKSIFPNMWYIIPTLSYYHVVSSHYMLLKWLCFEVGIRFDIVRTKL